MNKILLNILAIFGLILVMLSVIFPHGTYGLGCFALGWCFAFGGTIFGLAMLKKHTKFLDHSPEEIKVPEKLQHVSIFIAVVLLTMFSMLGIIIGLLIFILLNPYESISITIVNTVFPVTATMMATLPPGFIQLILQLLLVGFGGVGILFPLVMICNPEFRNDVFVIGSDTRQTEWQL